MDGSAAVVLGLTLVLILAVGVAMFVYVVSPGLSDEEDEEARKSDLNKVVHGVNRALRSGYEYDLDQDKLLHEAKEVNKKQETALSGLKKDDDLQDDAIKENRRLIDKLEKRLDEQGGSGGALGTIANGLGSLLSNVDFGSLFGGGAAEEELFADGKRHPGPFPAGGAAFTDGLFRDGFAPF